MKEKIAVEAAQVEFDRFVDLMDLDVDVEHMNEDEVSSFKNMERSLIKSIQSGALTINDDGEAVYTPQRSDNPNPITFHERTGATLMATDHKKDNQNMAKTYAAMGDMCRVPAKTFALLKGRDIKTCEKIYTLLMG